MINVIPVIEIIEDSHVIQGSWFWVQNLKTIHFLRRSNHWVTGPSGGGSNKDLSFTVVSIHKGLHAGTCDYNYGSRMQNTYLCKERLYVYQPSNI